MKSRAVVTVKFSSGSKQEFQLSDAKANEVCTLAETLSSKAKTPSVMTTGLRRIEYRLREFLNFAQPSTFTFRSNIEEAKGIVDDLLALDAARSRASEPSDRVAEPILDMMNHDLAADADLSLDPSDELRRRVAAESRVAELEREVERLKDELGRTDAAALCYNRMEAALIQALSDIRRELGQDDKSFAPFIDPLNDVKTVKARADAAESQLTALRESQKEVAEMKAALTKIAKGEHDPYRSPDGLARDALAALANGTPRP